jgi:hypothetical protein
MRKKVCSLLVAFLFITSSTTACTTSQGPASGIRILPAPGEIFTNSQNVSSQVELEEVMVSEGPSGREYISPAYPGHTIKVNDSIMVVTGRVHNGHPTFEEIAMYATGYDKSGKEVAWTIDAAHIPGQIGLRLGLNEPGIFILHLNASKDIKTIRIFANIYAETPP